MEKKNILTHLGVGISGINVVQENMVNNYNKTKTERDELFSLIESIHHLFESDKPITKDSVIGVAIELAYKTFKTN